MRFANIQPQINLIATNIFKILVFASLGAISIGCTVGPNYIPPTPNASEDWNSQLPPGLRRDKATLSRWWTTLNDPKLNNLIERAVESNLNLRQAALRINEARSQRAIVSSGQFPTLNTAGSATRIGLSENTPILGGATNSLYAIGFDASWELDLFGRVKRQVEAAESQLAASKEQYQDVLVTLVAEVALNYTEIRSFQEHLALIKANQSTQEKTLELVQSNVNAGEVSRLDLEQAQTHLELTHSQIPAMETGLKHAEHRLAVLLGLKPGSFKNELTLRKGIPVPPASIAVGVPAEALRRRPDVRRAERELAAQTALVGVATADLYPRFRLFGSIGLNALSTSGFFSSSNKAFAIGPSMQWNIFDAGRIRSNINVQTVRQEQVLLAYEQTVLGALHEVEDSIFAFGKEQVRRKFLMRAEQSVKRTLTIARDQYSMGEANFLNVLDAERSLLTIQDQLVTSNAAITSYAISLYKALGGGWVAIDPNETSSIIKKQGEVRQNEG